MLRALCQRSIFALLILELLSLCGLAALQIHHAHIGMTIAQPRKALLLSLSNPDLCVLLLTLGTLLIDLEIMTPGTVVPGTAGLLLVLLAGRALFMVPLSGAGVALCIAAGCLLLLEARFPAYGISAGIGMLALVIGLRTLLPGPVPPLRVSWMAAISAGLGFGTTAALAVLGMEARRTKRKIGSEALLGSIAVAHATFVPEGQV